MAASKLVIFGTSLLRCGTKSAAPTPFTVKSLRLCTVAAVDNVELSVSTGTDCRHPWPEWVKFVDNLRSNGYFPLPPTSEDKELGSGAVEDDVYATMNLLKEPCLSFARDRYDIFRSLSTNDIRTVVEHGCPNLLRKAVNSGKRLRVYVQVDEADACSSCNLRGSCDRAYVMLKDSENARTVDIVRTLLLYALDPLVISAAQKPPGRELVESSARKLLMELIELSATSPDPELPKPAVNIPRPREGSIKFVDDDTIEGVADKRGPPLVDAFDTDVEMKRGDWMCSKCNFLNFAKNLRCLRCKEDGPKRVHMDDFDLNKGDWICQKNWFPRPIRLNLVNDPSCFFGHDVVLECHSNVVQCNPRLSYISTFEHLLMCDFVNFSRNSRCLKCRAEGPKRVGVDEVVKKKGDWNCPKCDFMNFASNRKCLHCEEARPKRELRPGDWECPSCDYLNYSRNKFCGKCKGKRPQETISEYEEQLWRSPY